MKKVLFLQRQFQEEVLDWTKQLTINKQKSNLKIYKNEENELWSPRGRNDWNASLYGADVVNVNSIRDLLYSWIA